MSPQEARLQPTGLTYLGVIVGAMTEGLPPESLKEISARIITSKVPIIPQAVLAEFGPVEEHPFLAIPVQRPHILSPNQRRLPKGQELVGSFKKGIDVLVQHGEVTVVKNPDGSGVNYQLTRMGKVLYEARKQQPLPGGPEEVVIWQLDPTKPLKFEPQKKANPV